MKLHLLLVGLIFAFAFNVQAENDVRVFEDFSTQEALDFDDQLDLEEFLDLDLQEDSVAAGLFKKKKRWKCVARNGRGARYVGKSKKKRKARRKAMRECRHDSWRPKSCRIVRCKKKKSIGLDF